MVRTIGIEEELLIVDPETRAVTPGAGRVLKELREHGRPTAVAASAQVDRELFRHQLEIRTDPVERISDALAQLRRSRRTAGEAAEAESLAAVASGTAPRRGHEQAVSPGDRYRDMVHIFGDVAREAGVCGMHVHVSVESDEEGVAAIDRIAPWLPCLLAISANSPFHEDHDTGYASWRSQVWSRWPSAGRTEQFGSVERYYAVRDFLVSTGAARDDGMYYLDARLAKDHPTVEIRVADVCTDPEHAVLVAALVRGLVETAVRWWRSGAELRHWRAEELRACHWRAARHGVAERLVHPLTRTVQPAREVLDAMVAEVRPALEDAGDAERVLATLDDVLAHSGATAQRAAFERTGGVDGVVDDLVARTRASWNA